MIGYMGNSRSSRVRYFRKLLKDFEDVCRKMGGIEIMVLPLEKDEIDKEYKEAKRKLIGYIGSRI